MRDEIWKKSGISFSHWAHRSRQTVVAAGAGVVLVALAALAQGNPIAPPAGFGRVPQGANTCSVEKSCADLAPLMIQSAEGTSPLEQNLRTLTDSIGGRVTGSAAAARALSWGVAAMRKAGIDSVHREKFMVPAGWSEGRTRVEVLGPAAFPVRLVSAGWSPPTPTGGVTADIVDLEKGEEADFARAGAAVKGAIVLIHSVPLVSWADLDREYNVQPGMIRRAHDAGAAAIFWMSSRPNLLLYRHTVTPDGRIEMLPQAIVAREDAERIARFLAVGQTVRVHFEMPNRVSGPVE